ncbi:MAG: RNA polymerase sigma factor [Phenylobacterium sp.]|uniref:RNA polymerase sigma factor n=1 Tax=Phenylobacterium sp. TaxID=1871053 RepID=UPI001A3F6585|nr:RNA polymerase sigma factor [Phenylobacterium sp.]MBL8770148.1 RNA polymerase sigma factor [Phenylobacterium sp.]
MGRDDIDARIAAVIPRLHRFAWALTGCQADADDLTQAALERALANKPKLAVQRSVEAWIIRVARNLWLDQLRRRRVRDVAVDPSLLASATEDAAHVRLEAEEALRALRALPPGQREVAALILVEGYSYQEAADALQAPIGTVMSRLSRARAALANLLLGRGDAQVQGAAP